MKKSLALITSLALLLTLAGCQSSDPETEQSADQQTQTDTTNTETPTTRKVETFTVSDTPQQIPSTTPTQINSTKIGTVDSAQKVTIKSEVAGKIEKINFNEGDQIDQDTIVAVMGSSLNADIQDINFQNALISLKNAEEQLASKRQANQQSIENTKLSIDQAAVQLETARRSAQNISRSTNLTIDQLIENDPRWYTEQDSSNSIYYSTPPSNYNNSTPSYSRYYDYYGSTSDYNAPRTAIKKSAQENSDQTDQNPMQDIDAQVRQIRQSIEKAQDSYYTQMSSAQSQITLAEIQLENAKQLFELKKTQISLEEQSLQDQIEQLSGQVALADRNRKTREIKSPIKGTLLKKLIEEGETVNPGQAIAEVGKVGIIKVKVTLTQQEALKYKPNQPVAIISPDKKVLPGIVSKLPFTFNEQTKTGTLEIELENPDQILKPGMIVEVNFELPKQNNDNEAKKVEGIWIPLNATYFRTDIYVFAIKDGKAEKVFIETGEIANGMIEVTKGLQKGDQVILDRHDIQEGIEVESK